MKVRYDPVNVAYMALVHVLGVAAFFLPWPRHALLIGALWHVAVMGASTVGLHRLISHRAFRAPRWVEHTLVSVAMLSGQGSPLQWAANHRLHHAHTDGPRDVHSPRRGFFHAHMGWILAQGSTDPDAWRTVCRDLADDAYYRWLLRWRMAPQVLYMLTIGLTMGWGALPACFFLPMVFWMHATYCVNSVCHTPIFGRRDTDTRDDSRNVWWVSIVALGEGWHNNHHAAASSARLGWRWWQLDPGWWFIRGLAAVGLAWDVRAQEGP